MGFFLPHHAILADALYVSFKFPLSYVSVHTMRRMMRA